MALEFQIRPYEATDESAVIDVWSEAMWADPIDVTVWRIRYLLDPNFDAADCLVAIDHATNQLAGFALGFSNKSGGSTRPVPPDGWVVAFGVLKSHRRRGIGRALMRSLERRWIQAGLSRIVFGPYVPSYVAPGIDELAYADAIEFLTSLGAETLDRPLSMKISLTGYRPIPAVGHMTGALEGAGVAIRPAVASDILPLMQFLAGHFPHWRADAVLVLQDLVAGDPRFVSLFVAERHGRIIGYAQSRHERFGPFGVNEEFRGRGIGGVLLANVLLSMRSRGFHCAWFLWTSDRAARLYRDHGFEEVRRFALMSKNISPAKV